MKITVCIGSSCHLKGSRQIVERLQELIAEKNVKDTVELCGTFCMGNCVHGVCVKVDEEQFSLTPDDTDTFFDEQVLAKLN